MQENHMAMNEQIKDNKNIENLSKKKIFSAKNVARIAVFSALSFILYMFVKIKLPFIFPSFLELQISDLPALIAGFMMGPLSGSLVIIVRCLLKLPFSQTFFVGELGDLVIGLLFVLPAALFYKKDRTKRGALIGLSIGAVAAIAGSLIINAVVLLPFYMNAYGMEAVLGMIQALFPAATESNLMSYYLPLSVLPFNILRTALTAFLTFILYKKTGKLFERIFAVEERNRLLKDAEDSIIDTKMISHNENETFKAGFDFADSLTGGEVILLDGELGAGKTVFTKGIASKLGVTETVTSPTFAIMNEYSGDKLKLCHIDAYRITAEEAEMRGITEELGRKDNVCVIEWGKNIIEAICVDTIKIKIIGEGNSEREIIYDK